jgi:hypothetical protein
MSYCTPCPPCETDIPLTCEPYGTVSVGNRVVVEDDAFCTKTLANPATKSWLIWDNGIKWEEYAALYLEKSGGTMTGALILNADPSAALGAATKQYVDAGDALKVSKSGDTMTGLLVLSADPSANLGAATKQYADLKVAKTGDTMTGALVVNSTISSNSTILANGSASKIGYTGDASGSTIQFGSLKTQSVTLNKPTGGIQLNNGNIPANSAVTFILNNTVIETGDLILVNHVNGGTPGAYNIVSRLGSNPYEAEITVRNLTSGALAEYISINFFILKAGS